MGKKRKPKNGPPWWPCETTGKKGYATKLDALEVLVSASRRKAVQRAYECPHCGRWHMSSQPKRAT